jgi:hypothetical protein
LFGIIPDVGTVISTDIGSILLNGVVILAVGLILGWTAHWLLVRGERKARRRALQLDGVARIEEWSTALGSALADALSAKAEDHPAAVERVRKTLGEREALETSARDAGLKPGSLNVLGPRPEFSFRDPKTGSLSLAQIRSLFRKSERDVSIDFTKAELSGIQSNLQILTRVLRELRHKLR